MAESLLKDVTDLFEDIETVLTQDVPHAKDEEKVQAVRQADHKLEEAEELLERAELEIKSCAKEERGRLLKQVRAMQHQLDLLQQRVNRERHAAQTPAYSLGRHVDGDGDEESDEDIMGAPAHGQDPVRRTLLGYQERIDRTSARVRNATQIALETEAIGSGVLGDLHGQRDTIVRVSGALDDTDARLGSTQRTLRNMAWRAMQMKAVWYLIGGALLAIIVVLVYIGVR